MAGKAIELATENVCNPNPACRVDERSSKIEDGPPGCACLLSPEYHELK